MPNHSQLQQSKIIKIDKYLHKYLTNICGRVFIYHCALRMMIMASIFLSGLGWVFLQACFVGRVGLGPLATGLGWVGSQKIDPRPCLTDGRTFNRFVIVISPREMSNKYLYFYSCHPVTKLQSVYGFLVDVQTHQVNVLSTAS